MSTRRNVACLLAALALAVPAAAETPKADAAALRAEIADFLDEYVADRHYDPKMIDRPRIIDGALSRRQAGASPRKMQAWIGEEVEKAFFGFAKRGAKHDDRVRYRLPFPLLIPRYVTQGVGGKQSHTHPSVYHSWDFVLPKGTPLLAARAGVVARVVDGFVLSTHDPRLGHQGNSVHILHADGTYSVYGHLQKGIPIREGQRVNAGDVVGFCGTTGFTLGPHLHFHVNRRLSEGSFVTVPIKFGPGSKQGFVPEEGKYYGSPGRPNLNLRVSVNGKPVSAEDITPIRRGAMLPLRAELVSKDGRVMDVTKARATRYASVTLWSLEVDAEGRIKGKATRGFESIQAPRQYGSAVVMHGDPQGPLFGFAQVWFEIVN